VNPSDQLRSLLPEIAHRERAEPEDYPAASVSALYSAGVVAAPFPASAGGAGWRLTDAVAAVEAIAEASPSTALNVSMPLGLAGVLGVGRDIAPPAERSRWAELVEQVSSDYGRGLVYAACNSEKGAGGSLEATRTVAAKGEDGRFRITGEKILASSGRYATTFFSTAKVSPDDPPGAGVVEFFFVQADSPGVDIPGLGRIRDAATESQTVRYDRAPARELMGFPNSARCSRFTGIASSLRSPLDVPGRS
jgi:alkylation response protein AidB-like acyl-CoA dehydrogenase